MPMMTTERRWWSQPKVNLTTQDVLGCLDSSHSVTLEADEVWLSLDHPGNTSGSPLLRTSSTCHLQVRGRGQGMMSLLIFKVACFTKNQLVVHSRMRNRDRFVCDPTGWVAPGIELAMTSNVASVSIEINDTDVSFNLQAQFKTIPERSTYKLERRNVSQYLGFIQTFNWTEGPDLVHYNKYIAAYWDETHKLVVPRGQSVMFSTPHMEIEAGLATYKCMLTWLELYTLNVHSSAYTLLGKICNASPLSPVVSETTLAYVYFNKEYDYHALFRLLFTIHEMTSQPESLTRGVWNCSVPFWPDFRFHLVCNRHKECASGEDEQECPYSLCEEGGVLVASACFQLIKTDGGMGWNEANMKCRQLRGVLASFSGQDTWKRVNSIFRFYRFIQLRIFVGLRSTPGSFPKM